MAYPNLQRHILEIFAEAQDEANKRRSAYSHMIWGEQWRSGRFRFPVAQTELGHAPALATCIKCGKGITSSDLRVISSHVRLCGRPPVRAPQRK